MFRNRTWILLPALPLAALLPLASHFVCLSGVMIFMSLVICLFCCSGGKHEREGPAV